MNFYRHYLFPYVLDWAMQQPVLKAPRQRVLARAQGRVLEIGFGTGVNLAYYPDQVRELEALDPESLLAKRVSRRIAQSGRKVHFHQLAGESLPFADNSFDTLVCTLTLCSVQDPQQVLGEVYRVLKPGGRLLLLEHGASPDPKVQRWQHRLNGVQQACGGGCQLIRPTKELVAASGLVFEQVSQYYLPKVPRFLGFMTEGCACKPLG